MGYKCKYCGKVFENRMALGGHVSHCACNDNKKRNITTYKTVSQKSRCTYIEKHPEKYVKNAHIFHCKKCGKEYILNLTDEEFKKGQYTKYCSLSCRNGHKVSAETKKKISESLVGNGNHYITPNKRYKCKYCGKEFTIKDNGVRGRKFCSDTCREKWMEEEVYAKNQHGKGKSGWYKGIHCDSSWELAFVLYHMDNDIPIQRCKERRTYTFEGKTYKYYPDFCTGKEIIEIKGYKNKKWFAKEQQNKDIKVLNRKEIMPYLKYAINKYGKDFTKLYEEK